MDIWSIIESNMIGDVIEQKETISFNENYGILSLQWFISFYEEILK